jgi:hypothetical protein
MTGVNCWIRTESARALAVRRCDLRSVAAAEAGTARSQIASGSKPGYGNCDLVILLFNHLKLFAAVIAMGNLTIAVMMAAAFIVVAWIVWSARR